MKEQSTERRPHSDIFICVVLTQLNSPSERLMRRNGLVEEPTGIRATSSPSHNGIPEQLVGPPKCITATSIQI
eukprot:superscaffoldBa00000317_g3742